MRIGKSRGNLKRKFDANNKPKYLTDEFKKDDIKLIMHFEKYRKCTSKEDDLEKDIKRTRSSIKG